MTGVLVKRRHLDTDADRLTATGSDWRETATNQNTKDCWQHQELKRGLEQTLPHSLSRSQPHRHLGFRLLASRAARKLISGFFWLCRTACGILVPRPGMKPGPSAVEVQSPNHRTAGEFPNFCFFKIPSLWYFVLAALGNAYTIRNPEIGRF